MNGETGTLQHFLQVLIGALLAVISAGCDYGRMYDQDAVKTYERKMPVTDGRSIPVTDGYMSLARADAPGLQNPLPYSPESVAKGRLSYAYYCIQCHGPRLDGQGTVGQSFAPMPANLISRPVLSLPDGVIYSRIRLGFGRHPMLFTTVSSEETWATVIYIRSQGGKE